MREGRNVGDANRLLPLNQRTYQSEMLRNIFNWENKLPKRVRKGYGVSMGGSLYGNLKWNSPQHRIEKTQIAYAIACFPLVSPYDGESNSFQALRVTVEMKGWFSSFADRNKCI